MAFHSKIQVFVIIGLLFYSLVNATVNSVCADPGLGILRACAVGCVGCVGGHPDEIGYHIGCVAANPNECWCRSDLFNLATAGLSDCVSRSCTIGGWEGDYSSALHFYTSYCQKAGYTQGVNGPSNAIATLTVDSNAPTITKVTLVTPTSVLSLSTSLLAGASSTSSATTMTTTRHQVTVDITSTLRDPTSTGVGKSAGGGNGVSLSDRIALGVGIGIGLPATIAALVVCCLHLGGRHG